MKRKIIVIWLGFVYLVMPALSAGGVPGIRDVNITDVTPVSFSIVFVVNEPSNVDLKVFNSPDCLIPVAGISVNSISNDATGVSKATATGLISATPYCYQIVATSKSTSQTSFSPTSPSTVITETQTIRTYIQNSDILPFSNDLIYHQIFRFDQTPGTGDVLLISIDGGSNPVSASVGDGIPSPGTLIDLNNIYSASTMKNMNLRGNERMRLLEVRGLDGCTLERWRKVPADNEIAEVKAPGVCFMKEDIDCNDVVDIGDIILDINGYGGIAGINCFNSDLDQDGNNLIDIGDIILVIGKFGTIH